MSEVAEKTGVFAEENGEAQSRGAHRTAQPQSIEADDSQVVAAYTNYCRVMGTPEELIVDFGLNTQGAGVPMHPIKLTQRALMNFYTAKRLLGALQLAHAGQLPAFEVLEAIIQKQVVPQGSYCSPLRLHRGTRLRRTATHHRAMEVLHCEWKKGRRPAVYRLRRTWRREGSIRDVWKLVHEPATIFR